MKLHSIATYCYLASNNTLQVTPGTIVPNYLVLKYQMLRNATISELSQSTTKKIIFPRGEVCKRILNDFV